MRLESLADRLESLVERLKQQSYILVPAVHTVNYTLNVCTYLLALGFTFYLKLDFNKFGFSIESKMTLIMSRFPGYSLWLVVTTPSLNTYLGSGSRPFTVSESVFFSFGSPNMK